MKRRLTVAALVAMSAVATAGVAAAEPSVAVDGYNFRVLGEELVAQHTVGNLSGIDYRPTTGDYVLVGDDTSRVRTADLALGDSGFSGVRFTGSTKLLAADGGAFPQGGSAVRVDPADGSLLWSREGNRDVPRYGSPRLTDTTVQRSAVDGAFVTQYPTAPHTAASADEQGVRDGLGIEGLTLNTGGSFVISALEAPLLQDGATGPVRLSFASRTSGTVLSQLAYQPAPAPRHGSNGVVEILAVDASRYLVLERAVTSGGRHSIRLYEANTVGARSVLPFASLDGAAYTPVQKRLLVDFGDLGLSRVGNLEGMTWGPTLASGERTLVLVSDNECDTRTQLVALAVTLS